MAISEFEILEPLNIRLRKARLAGALLGLLAILIPLGIWALNVEGSILAAEGRSQTLVRILGVTLLFVGALLTAFVLPRLFSSSPALILDETGLFNNATILGSGYASWCDIRELHFGEAERQRLLFVILNQPHQYLERQSRIKRILGRARERRGDPSFFSIPIKHLAISENDLADYLARYMSAYHASTRA
ncbi:STM3941 family protein [Duganella sp. BJB475]|nr:STM3941 family protein [Duganella sp. BJB475]